MDWDEFFFNLIYEIAKKSKDPSTKVGTVIVNNYNSLVSIGFNGFPRGIKDKPAEVPERYERPNKYLWIEHAERNAIYNAARMGTALDGCRIYLEYYPCSNCCRGLIQCGINEIVIDGRGFAEREAYWNQRWKDDVEISKQMIAEAEIKVRFYGHKCLS
jgi:dCMP deaminase